VTILAHGAAGAWDELVLVLCPLIFLGVLIIAGRRRRPPPADPSEPADPSN
jgi:hypothetical protein